MDKYSFIISILSILLLICIIIIGFNHKLKIQRKHREQTLLEDFNLIKKNLETNIGYARQIASGDYSVMNNASGIEDELGKSLVEMSTNLKTAEIEDRKRSWAMMGLSKLSEIIRLSNNDLTELSYELVLFLVKYLEANQGGLFVINDSNPDHRYLELLSCYAFERRKYLDKRIELDEGLLGQAIQENDLIYLTEIPDDYVKITSGLGTSTPKSLIIVPLKTESAVIGAIEIASFKTFDAHEREFLSKASESIAASLISSRINDNTSKLLHESQQLTEQLKQQEEEVRQNLEEMQATQEEMVRKEHEINKLLGESRKSEILIKEKMEENIQLEAENKTRQQQMLIELENNRKVMTSVLNNLPQRVFLKDKEGRFLESVATDLNKTVEDLLGKNDFELHKKEDAEKFWNDEKVVLDKMIKIDTYEDFEVEGTRKYMYTVKMPFKFPNNDQYGILGYQSDITELKTLEIRIKDAELEIAKKEMETQQELASKNALIEELKKQLKA
jgi:methyl-accepting chemotaxis protein